MAKLMDVTVTGISESPTKIVMTARDLEFVIDEPPAMGGTNAGPNPVEILLGSLAGCINIVVYMVAKERGTQIDGLRVTVAGSLDPSRLMGAPDAPRAGFESITLTAEVDSPASAEEIDEVLRIVETRCPVADNLGSATPVSLVRAATVAV